MSKFMVNQDDLKNINKRIWKHINVTNNDDCWKWNGCTDRYGNGIINVRKHLVLVRNVAYQIHNYLIQPTDKIIQSCKNRLCCNPNHLHRKNLDEQLLDRFWEKVDKRGENECWEWLGSKDKNGYGQIAVNSIVTKAHRLSWELCSNDEIPEEMLICHRCDNPSCINPNHLFLGNQSDNMIDMLRKNRGKHPKGENHYNAKLTEKDVLEIRKLINLNKSCYEIGKMFKVSKSAISHIKFNRTWTIK